MDEYIKREDALEAVLFALVGTGYQSQAIYAIRDVQTADVAPRAEVDRLKNEIEVLTNNSISTKYPHCVLGSYYAILTKSLEDYDKLLADISAEVAREIFEEIEKYILENCCVVDDDVDRIWKHIADLKKKYTEENG